MFPSGELRTERRLPVVSCRLDKRLSPPDRRHKAPSTECVIFLSVELKALDCSGLQKEMAHYVELH